MEISEWVLWLLLSITSLCFLSQAKKRLSAGSGRLPPGPRPLPIIGNLLLLRDNPHKALSALSKTYGPIMTLRLGSVITIVISSPEAAKEVVLKHDAVLSYRYVPDCLRILGHEKWSLVWMDPSQRWRNFRRLCNTQLFTPQRLDALQHLRHQKVQEMVRHIADLSSRGEAVEIGRLAFATTLNLLSRTIFSTDLVGLGSDSASPRTSSNEFKDVYDEIMAVFACPNISDFFPSLAWLDLQGIRRRSTKLFEQVHRILEEQIERRRMQGKDSTYGDFLDILLECQRGNPDNFDRTTLLTLLTDLSIAGSDTGSKTVESAMTELLRNPDVMAMAKEEITRVIGLTRDVEEDDMNQLPYLQAVVKETLRMHPPVPFLIPRQAKSTIEVLGYVVPEGTRVLVNCWDIGRESDVWSDPNEFKPERFLDKEIDFKGRDFEFTPFGFGRRICPGLPLAVRMVHLTLASLLHKFEWKLPQGMEPKDISVSEKIGLTLAMACPIQATAMLGDVK